MFLRHQSNLRAKCAQGGTFRGRGFFPQQVNAAGLHGDQPHEAPQQGGLPGSVGANQSDRFTTCQPEAHIVEDRIAAKTFGDISRLDIDRRNQGAVRSGCHRPRVKQGRVFQIKISHQ